MGDRIRGRRELRRWSIRHAASRAGIAHTTWSRIERGELRTDRYMVADIAAALECSIADLTGQPYTPADRQLEAAHIAAERLWQTMMALPLDEPPTAGSPAERDLWAEAELIRDLYARTDYAGALGRLVGLAPALHTAAHGPDSATALTAAVQVYGVGMGALLNLGHPAYAWLAAQRCTEAAQRLNDPAALAVAAVNRGRVSSHTGAFGPARSMVERAAAELDQHTDSPAALDVLGFTHLARAHHATGMRDQAAAADHLAEAGRLAQRTGETEAWDLQWGPRNVSLWTVSHQIDTGRPGEAVETATGLDVASLPAVRTVYLYTDLARALTDVRRDDEAVRMLLTAERVAPQHTRSSAAARETARALLHKARRASAVQGLCERMGVAN
ncbi:helix-turn-helix domain-containing protein [Actinoplanes subtropicus]|uniref:helix-turn-helix domain-containing protein n=1 Tax=Actinoplanes subtropicus TaxID=543632 RepID=UPI001FE1CC82|nr:helix-turn-helix transcriptional regulator [Actinoplanes subtropicus]